MITIAPFRNADFHAVQQVWARCLAASEGRLQPFWGPIMEENLFGSLLFRHNDLLIAREDKEPVGLVHALLVPNQLAVAQESEVGVICLLIVTPDCSEPDVVRANLLFEAEKCLERQGARTIYGGAFHEGVPFYCGYYGAGEPVGIFESDKETHNLFLRSGYAIRSRTTRLELNLRGFTPRLTMQSRDWLGRVSLDIDSSPKAKNWRDALFKTRNEWLETKFFLGKDKTVSSGKPLASFLFCIPYADAVCSASGVISFRKSNVAHLINIFVKQEYRGRGLLTHLYTLTFPKELIKAGIERVETQVTDEFPTLVPYLLKNGWTKTDSGAIFIKTLSPKT